MLFIVSGPSGSGKSTLSKRVVRNIKRLSFGVSYTTRLPRRGEIDGIDYRFITDREFDDLIKSNCLAEWAIVHGRRYGTPAESIKEAQSSGIDLLLDIDVQGARYLRKRYKDGTFIFVTPPSLEALRKRLLKRSSEGTSEIKKRIEDAKKETREMRLYDYIIINDSLNEAIKNLTSIILAERCRRDRVVKNSKLGF